MISYKIEMTSIGGLNQTQNERQSKVLAFGVILVSRVLCFEVIGPRKKSGLKFQFAFSQCISPIHKNPVFFLLHNWT